MTMTHSNRRLSLGRLLALSLVFLPGCGDDPVEPDPTLTGEWSGQVTLPFGTAAITMGLSENDAGEVTGTMTWTVAGEMASSGPVMGTHSYPTVSLNLQIEAMGMPLTGKYTGRLATEDRMEGTFSTDDGTISGSLAMERKTE